LNYRFYDFQQTAENFRKNFVLTLSEKEKISTLWQQSNFHECSMNNNPECITRQVFVTPCKEINLASYLK
jgi:hypothetical protein